MHPIIMVTSFALLLAAAGCQEPKQLTEAEALANQAAEAGSAGDFAAAAALLTKAIELDPNVPEAWICLGMASVQTGEQQAARQAYERALALHAERYAQGQQPNDLYQQIFVLRQLRRDAEATRLLEQGRHTHPTDKQLRKVSDQAEPNEFQLSEPLS